MDWINEETGAIVPVKAKSVCSPDVHGTVIATTGMTVVPTTHHASLVTILLAPVVTEDDMVPSAQV